MDKISHAREEFGDVVSVVIPAYNSEGHINECLLSLERQTYPNWRAIVIDDGSSDATPDICDEAARKDERILVLHIDNSGVSAARNLGISLVKSRFITFVDADDVLPENAIELLVESARLYSADMVYGSFGVMSERGVVRHIDDLSHRTPGLVEDEFLSLSTASPRSDSLSGSCWRILFRASFLINNDLIFPLGVTIAEDQIFIMRCLGCAPRVANLDEVVYLLRREGESTTQRYMPRFERDLERANVVLRDFCTGNEELENRYWECVADSGGAICVNVYKQGSPYGFKERRLYIRDVMRRYRDAVNRVKWDGELPAKKLVLLKAGTAIPAMMWLALEVRFLLKRPWRKSR